MRNFRSLLFTFVLLIFTHVSLYAQQTLGIKWEVPQNPDSATTQLERFNDLGISIIEVERELTADVWQKIDSLQFEVYGSFGIEFPVTSTFNQPDSALINRIQNKASAFLSKPSVTSIELFEFGATYSPAFTKSLEPIVGQLKKSGKQKLYYTSSDADENALTDFILVDFKVSPGNIETLSIPKNSTIDGVIYSPSPKLKNYLSPFKKFLEATSAHPDKSVFVHSDWLLPLLDKHPRFSETLHTISAEPEAIFPLPRENLPAPSSSVLPIIILLVVWGTIGLHYNTSPLYRRSLFRYFVAHKFFIDDIFQRQIRSIFPAFAIIIQNALLVAACSFAAFSALLTPLGQEAFFYHFPSIGFWGNTAFSIFIWTFLTSLLISFLNIIWLFIAHRKISIFRQITTIYAWPLQLNFLLSTVAITLYAADSGSRTIAAFTILAFLLLLLSFIFASVDTLRFARSKFLHLAKTSVPYLIALSGLVIWILTKEPWLEILSLTLNLK